MPRIAILSLLGFLVGCGGSEPTSPPPPPASVPASITIQTGDAQLADPGSAVPVAPKVLVRDAAARPVAGASVTFAIDSGGGSLGTSTATTGSDGTATTSWTLGPSEGVNTLVASVAGLTPVRFHATGRIVRQTLIDTSSVPASGGVLSYGHGGDSLSGVRLTLFDGTYQGPSRFAVTADRVTRIPNLPPGVSQLGPVFVVGTDSGFAAKAMALRLPARGASDQAIGSFFYDPATGTLEGIPLIGRDDSTVTIATQHFRADQLMVHSQASSASARLARLSRAAAPLGFGDVRIVNLSAPRAALTAPITTGFLPGVDDWEFTNYGTYRERDGICAGMSVTAMYYYYAFRSQGGLTHHYDTFSNLEWDNPGGEAVATLIQGSLDSRAKWQWLNQLIAYAASASVPYQQLAYESLALTMQVTHQPQYMALRDVSSGHAVVAYGVNNGVVPFADPNNPGLTTAAMTYSAGAFAPVAVSTSALTTPDLYPDVYFVGVSSMINAQAVAQAFGALAQGTIATTVFPALIREYYDKGTSKWTTLPASDTIVTTHRILALRTRCPTCTRHRPTAPSDHITSIIRDTLNNVLGQDAVEADTAAVIVFGRGSGSFRVSWDNFNDGLTGGPVSTDPPRFADSYVGNKLLTIIAPTFAISPNPVKGEPTVDVTLTASSAGFSKRALTTSTFIWKFGDGTAPVMKLGDSTVVHKWAEAGTYTLTAQLQDSTGDIIAADTTTATIKVTATYVWQLQSISVQQSVAPDPVTRADTTVAKTWSGFVSDFIANPTHVGIQIYGAPTGGVICPGVAAVINFPDGQATDTIPSAKDERAFVGECGDLGSNISGSLSVGPLGTGAVVGNYVGLVTADRIPFPGGSINAAMAGKTLTGTFVALVRYSTGNGQITFGFTAKQTKP